MTVFDGSREPVSWLRCAALLVAAGAALSACADGDSETASARTVTATTIAGSGDLPDVLAAVGDHEIRIEDLPITTLNELTRLESNFRRERHTLLDAAVEEAVANRMLSAEAEERGVTVAELVAAETEPLVDPTDEDVETFYAENRDRLGGRPLDQLRGQIREYLKQTSANEQSEALDRRLREKYEVDIRLEPFRVTLDNQGSPALGPDDATVTLVEFSDFECPFCSRFFPTLKRLEEEYSDRVRIVYRQYPIPSLHPAAFKAAEASLCAHEQGEFWAYHDLLFQEQDRLAVRDLKEKAGRLGLNRGDFDRCLDTGRYVEQVQDDIAEGQASGVSGTPALFVNGIPIPGGAVAYDVVAAALDAELARAAD
jgi:protein-disulfide isomerase